MTPHAPRTLEIGGTRVTAQNFTRWVGETGGSSYDTPRLLATYAAQVAAGPSREVVTTRLDHSTTGPHDTVHAHTYQVTTGAWSQPMNAYVDIAQRFLTITTTEARTADRWFEN